MIRCVLLDRPGSVEYLDVEDTEEAVRRYALARISSGGLGIVSTGAVFYAFADEELYRLEVERGSWGLLGASDISLGCRVVELSAARAEIEASQERNA